MSTTQTRLRAICHPIGEAMPIEARLGILIARALDAADELDELHAKLASRPRTPTGAETFDTIRQWAEDTFGPITAARTVERAGEEFEELREEPGDLSEAADVVICLARFPGLWAEVERKMRVNRGRQWRCVGDGTGYHVKAAQ